MPARTTAVISFAIRFIFGEGCSWRGAVTNGGSRSGADNGSSCGVVLELSNRFFGALAGARFFFGFRPRLLGIGATSGLARIMYVAIRFSPMPPKPPDGYGGANPHRPRFRRKWAAAPPDREFCWGFRTMCD
jgi:hypothetical protein